MFDLQRFYEIIPGVLIWLLLLSPVLFADTIPEAVIYLILFLTVLYALRGVFTFFGLMIGLYHYIKSRNVDYLILIKQLDYESLPSNSEVPEDKLPYHLIVIANYGEDYDVLQKSINSIVKQNYPLEKIFLAVSIEERKAKKDKEYARRGEYLVRDYGDIFGDRLFFFVHPEGISGEVIGAAANRTWGTKNAVAILEKRGYDISKFLITAPDGDIVLSQNFLAACTYKWLKHPKRNKRFYQTAVYTFNNNYWSVPIFIRVLSVALTIAVFASSVTERFRRETYSCYTLNLKLMKDVDYWDTSLGIDDTTFYWRPYEYLNGDWYCEVFWETLSADAVYHPRYIKNLKDQYVQYVRWGWGVISFPIAMKILLSKKLRVNIMHRVLKILHLIDVFVIGRIVSFLMAFGLPILLFFNESLADSTISVYAPSTLSTILSLLALLLIPVTFVKLLLIPKKPNRLPWLIWLIIILIEIPMNFIIALTYSFFPFVEATTRMMLGQQHATQVKWSNKQLAINK